MKLKFLKNAFILTLTSLILKSLGIVLKIYMSNTIGAEGMGLHQLIFSIYILASTFATAGVSTAVIRLVGSEFTYGNKNNAKKVFKKCLFISIFLGLLSSTIIFLFASPIGKYILNDVRTVIPIKILVFVFPFMSTASCVKGYFIARKNVSVPSKAQVYEQIIRLLFIFLALKRFASYDIATKCIAIVVSDITAEIISGIYSYIKYKADEKKLGYDFNKINTKTPVFKKFFSISLPISMNRYANTILHTIENVLVPNKLKAYSGSQSMALAEFGMLKGMAIPLIFFPASFLNAMSTLLIPEMSEAMTLKNVDKIQFVVKKAIHITLIISILIAGIFFIFSYEISNLIYHENKVGFIIKILAPIIPFMYLESIVTGMLQGLNEQLSSLKYLLFDSIIRIILVFIFVAKFGLTGFLGIMIISNISTSSLNLTRLIKVTGIKIEWTKWIIKPICSLGVAIFIFSKFITSSFSSIIFLVVGSVVISFTYILGLFITRSITINDLILKK
ncbi:MAG: polysaccharide biosynthesis protein [Clostridia bacterium]|nr:polysaccharide biosynthesis protein [Clostridia bacterium]